MLDWREDEGVSEIIERCVGCGEEIEPGTGENCPSCNAATHGDTCLDDHLFLCYSEKKPVRSVPLNDCLQCAVFESTI
jgi:hypothetical protein